MMPGLNEAGKTEGGTPRNSTHHKFFVPLTEEMRQEVEQYRTTERCRSFNEAVVELLSLGLRLLKEKAKKRGFKLAIVPHGRSRFNLELTKAAYREFEDWQLANRLKHDGRAVLILVREGLDEWRRQP